MKEPLDSPYMVSYCCLISNIGPNSAPLRDIRFEILVTLSLTLQGHSRSNVTVPLDSPYMVSY